MLSDVAATLSGGLFGAGVGLVRMIMQNSHDQKMRDCEEYYKYMSLQSKDPHFKWTRRALALTIVCFIPIFLILGALKGLPVVIGYQESHGFLTSLFSGAQSVDWVTFHGCVLPPALWFLAGQVISSYFVSKN